MNRLMENFYFTIDTKFAKNMRNEFERFSVRKKEVRHMLRSSRQVIDWFDRLELAA
jgi:hypothetical protein